MLAGTHTLGKVKKYFPELKKYFLKLQERATHNTGKPQGHSGEQKASNTKEYRLSDLICMRVQEQATLISGEWSLYSQDSAFISRTGVHWESLRYRKCSIAFSGWQLHRYIRKLKTHQDVPLILFHYVLCMFCFY